MDEQFLWKWIVENLWLPVFGVVGTLVAAVRYADLQRISALEAKLNNTVTKDEVLRLELLAERAVQQERFQEYVERVEQSRLEARETLASALVDIKNAQQRTDDKMDTLAERLFSTGIARDERRGGR